MSKKMSRREWSLLSLTGLAGFMLPPGLQSCKTSNVAKGGATDPVAIGMQSYSFRDRKFDEAIKAMAELGIRGCEVWVGHIMQRQPNIQLQPGEVRDRIEGSRKWKSIYSMEQIRGFGEKLKTAGIAVQSYNGSFGTKDPDADFDLVFQTAQALGAAGVTTSTTVNLVKRIDEFAQKYKMKVALHNHSNVEDPNQIATPDSFNRAMQGRSEYICINLDIGHFTAANFDPVEFIKNNHNKIQSIHIKDRKKNQGENVPLGEGDTPIAAVLNLIKDNKWNIPANIEYEYKGADTMTEVKKSLEYCRKILAG